MKQNNIYFDTTKYLLQQYRLIKACIQCNDFSDVLKNMDFVLIYKWVTMSKCSMENMTATLNVNLIEYIDETLIYMKGLNKNNAKLANFLSEVYTSPIEYNAEKIQDKLGISRSTYFNNIEKGIDKFSELFWQGVANLRKFKQLCIGFSALLPDTLLKSIAKGNAIEQKTINDYFLNKNHKNDVFNVVAFANTELLLQNYRSIQIELNARGFIYNRNKTENTSHSNKYNNKKSLGTNIYALFCNKPISKNTIKKLAYDQETHLLFRLYKSLNYMSSSDNYKGLYKELYYLYIDMEQTHTQNEIAEKLNLSQKCISDNRKKAINILSIILWGSMSIKNKEFRKIHILFSLHAYKTKLKEILAIKKQDNWYEEE